MKKNLIAALAAVALVSACATSSDYEEDAEFAATAEGREVASENAVDPALIAKDRVFFGFDKYNVDFRQASVLDEQVEYLNENADVQVVVEGHTDDRGTAEYNLGLGNRRANAVKDYLVNKGIDEARVKVISYGKEMPAVAGANENAWAQNRRAVIKQVK